MVNGDGRRSNFHLEINSLEDFVAFVAIVRGTDLTHLAELTARLTKSTHALAAAEVATEHAVDSPTQGGS
jgi:hypothetical protein